ncbi:MAG: alpha/beta fold hydrolase [Rubrimonas sp.]
MQDRADLANAPMLFLHGAFGGPEIWRHLAPWFAARRRRVLTPDLSAGPDGPRRLRDYVRAAERAADALGGAPIVVGHSLGGLVAQHLAARRRLPGVALIASPGPMGVAPSYWRLTTQHPTVFAMLVLTQLGGGRLLGVNAIRRAMFADNAPDDWIARNAPAPRPESPLALLDAMTWDIPNWMAIRGTPTLAILGDSDAFIPASDLVMLRFLYDAKVERIDGMGHGAPIDPHWKRVAWRIEDWLGGLGRAGPASARGEALDA